MNPSSENPRFKLARDSVVFQLKLIIDGLRDALLIPLAIIATIPGLIRGGEDADKEFKQVLGLGLQTERWIDLFGHHRPGRSRGKAASMDSILDQVEAVVVEQYQKGKSAAETRDAVRKAMRESGQPAGKNKKRKGQ